MHRHIAIAGLLALLSTTAGSEVLRCTDAAGNVSYTDQRCPPGARQSGQVQVPDAPPPAAPAPRAYAPQAPAAMAPAPAPAPTPAPIGPSVADQRASERAEAQQREIDRLREIERLRREADYAQDAAGYPYPGGYPPPVVQQDMRPQLRGCDAGGCHDTQGNTYNRSTGKLDRYQSLDGRNCRPVGTTVVCQ